MECNTLPPQQVIPSLHSGVSKTVIAPNDVPTYLHEDMGCLTSSAFGLVKKLVNDLPLRFKTLLASRVRGYPPEVSMSSR